MTPQMGLEVGKVPPNAMELEEAVLGALLLEKDALNDVIEILQPACFYREEHCHIYTAIQELFQESEPIDILSVTNRLKKTGQLELVGGAYAIAKLTDRVASSANAEFHARIILQKHIQRDDTRLGRNVPRGLRRHHRCFRPDAEQGLFAVTQGNIRKDVDKMSPLIALQLRELRRFLARTVQLEVYQVDLLK